MKNKTKLKIKSNLKKEWKNEIEETKDYNKMENETKPKKSKNSIN